MKRTDSSPSDERICSDNTAGKRRVSSLLWHALFSAKKELKQITSQHLMFSDRRISEPSCWYLEASDCYLEAVSYRLATRSAWRNDALRRCNNGLWVSQQNQLRIRVCLVWYCVIEDRQLYCVRLSSWLMMAKWLSDDRQIWLGQGGENMCRWTPFGLKPLNAKGRINQLLTWTSMHAVQPGYMYLDDSYNRCRQFIEVWYQALIWFIFLN